jgi:hypothetical protein
LLVPMTPPLADKTDCRNRSASYSVIGQEGEVLEKRTVPAKI